MKKILFLVLLLLFLGCSDFYSDANIASRNLSVAADQFEVLRRVVFYNGITDKYILLIEGYCSVEFYTDKFVVTVKNNDGTYRKHYLGRADNVFPFVEQLDKSEISSDNYRVIYKPKSIFPNIDLE